MKLKNGGKIILKKILIPVFSVLIIIFSWQLASIKINSPLILPSFFKVCKDFFALIQTKLFYVQLSKTFLRVICAFCFSIFAGIIFGFFCGKFQTVKKLISFPLAVLRVTPVVALILILVFSLSSSAVPIVASVLMTLPVIITTITEGVELFFKNLQMNDTDFWIYKKTEILLCINSVFKTLFKKFSIFQLWNELESSCCRRSFVPPALCLRKCTCRCSGSFGDIFRNGLYACTDFIQFYF